MGPFTVLGVSGGCFHFTVFSIEIFVSRVDPDHMLHFAASKMGLHCLHNTPKWVSSGSIIRGLRNLNYNGCNK